MEKNKIIFSVLGLHGGIFKIFLFILAFFLLYGCSSSVNPEFKTKSETQQLNQVSKVQTHLQVGDNPYDLVVVTTEGKTVRLFDFIEQKRPVIVYFMATWCPYCARDYAALSKVYKDYEDKVSILSISLDLNEDLTILKDYKNKYPELQKTMFAAGQNEILVNYRIKKTTTKYAIDKNGKIMYTGFGTFNEEQWRTLLDALIK